METNSSWLRVVLWNFRIASFESVYQTNACEMIKKETWNLVHTRWWQVQCSSLSSFGYWQICGRWVGPSKVMTGTFNLTNPHACTHKYPKHHHHKQDNISLFLYTQPVWLLSCLQGTGATPEGTRVEPVTKPIYISPETLSLDPPCAYTPRVLLSSHLIQPRPRQAPAGHALMTSSRLPLPVFRCGWHLKGREGRGRD